MSKKKPRHHILIGGTGRSGTSFLVKYLAGLGLETTYSGNYKNSSDWFENANAGLETFIQNKNIIQPYVAKSPWLSQYIDEVLDDDDLKIDLVIIPIRDLMDSAASRIMNETKSIYGDNNHMINFRNSWDSYGLTPGGVIYSLGLQDQARILSMDFHYLINKLVEADIPIVFLSFPKLAEEENYVYDRLKDFLPKSLTREKAVKEFNKLSDKSKIHFKGSDLPEFGKVNKEAINGDKYMEQILQQTNIENMSLKEIIKNKNKIINDLNNKQSEHNQIVQSLNSSSQEVERLKAEVESIGSQMLAIISSKSWMITKPIRAINKVFVKD
jgi:uncharacterized protein YoxC